MLGLLVRIAFLRPCLDDRPHAGDFGTPLFTPRELFGDRHPIRHIGLIGRFSHRSEAGDLLAQLHLDLASTLIRQRAVAAGVGVDLGAIERHCAQLQHAHLTRHYQHLHKQRFDLLEEASAEAGDRVVVGVLVGSNETERNRIVGCPLQFSARKHTSRIAVDQQSQQNTEVVGGLSRAAVVAGHRTQIKALDHLDYEPRKVPLRQPFIHRRRHQEAGIAVNGAEVAHGKEGTGRGMKRSSAPILHSPAEPC